MMSDYEYYEGVCPYTHRHCDKWNCDECDEPEVTDNE